MGGWVGRRVGRGERGGLNGLLYVVGGWVGRGERGGLNALLYVGVLV